MIRGFAFPGRKFSRCVAAPVGSAEREPEGSEERRRGDLCGGSRRGSGKGHPGDPRGGAR